MRWPFSKSQRRCEACGGTKYLSDNPQVTLCQPCFMVWYDTGIRTQKELGEESLRLKAAGQFPWTGPTSP